MVMKKVDFLTLLNKKTTNLGLKMYYFDSKSAKNSEKKNYNSFKYKCFSLFVSL